VANGSLVTVRVLWPMTALYHALPLMRHRLPRDRAFSLGGAWCLGHASQAHNIQELRDPSDIPTEMFGDEPTLPPFRGTYPHNPQPSEDDCQMNSYSASIFFEHLCAFLRLCELSMWVAYLYPMYILHASVHRGSLSYKTPRGPISRDAWFRGSGGSVTQSQL
jgi:hypothetical protein